MTRCAHAVERSAAAGGVLVALPFFRLGSPSVCVYCGDTATDEDHVVALSFQVDTDRRRKCVWRRGPVACACGDCNTHLNNRFFDTFLGRCEWANRRLQRLAEPVLWSERDMLELDYSLRTVVEQRRSQLLWLRQRADWYGSREFYLNLEQLTYEPALEGGGWLAGYFSSIADEVRHSL